MDSEISTLFIGSMIVPIYLALFQIYRKLGEIEARYDALCERVRGLTKTVFPYD